MYLLIDPSENNLHQIAILKNNEWHWHRQTGVNRDLLLAIDFFLKQENISPDSLKGILVVLASGQFTSTRLAVTIANTFHFANGVPIAGVLKEDIANINKCLAALSNSNGSLITATYSAEANIGKK